MRAKARGNKLFGAGDFAGALLAYQEAITALDMCIKQNTREQLETVPSEVWPSVFHALAICHSNAAQGILKLPKVHHKEVLIHAQTAMAFLKDRVIPEVTARKDMAQAKLTKAISDAKKLGATAESSADTDSSGGVAEFGGLQQLHLLAEPAGDAALEAGRELTADAFKDLPELQAGTECVLVAPSGAALGTATSSASDSAGSADTPVVLVTAVFSSPEEYPAAWGATPSAISAAKRAVQLAKEEWDVVKAEAAAKEKLHARTMLRLGRGLVLAGELKTAFAVLTDGRLRGEPQALALARQVKARLEAQAKKDKARWGGALKQMGQQGGVGAAGAAAGESTVKVEQLQTPPAEVDADTSAGAASGSEQMEELQRPQDTESSGFLGLSGGAWGALALGAAVIAGATYAGGLWGGKSERSGGSSTSTSTGSALRRK